MTAEIKTSLPENEHQKNNPVIDPSSTSELSLSEHALAGACSDISFDEVYMAMRYKLLNNPDKHPEY